jgi:hypothetical protein
MSYQTDNELIQPYVTEARSRAYNDCFGFVAKLKTTAYALGAVAIIPYAGQWGAMALGAIAIGRLIHSRLKVDELDQALLVDGDVKTLRKFTPKLKRKSLLKALETLEEAGGITHTKAPGKAPTAPTTADDADQWKPSQFDRQALLDSATGIAILGNSGSGKTVLASYLVGGFDCPVIVLDPHYETDSSPWGSALVISDKDEILTALEFMLKLLDRKDKRGLVIVCDEWPSVRLYAKAQGSSVADDFLLRYGSESRKFNKLAIFISQSGNTKALGLDGVGDFLENFALIRLQKIAQKYAKFSPNRELYRWVKSQGYAVLIGDDEACLHPNLGHHPTAFKGADPVGIDPIQSPPIPPDIMQGLHTHTPTHTHPKALPYGEPIPIPTHTPTHPPTPTHTPTETMSQACPHCGSGDVMGNGRTVSGKPRKRCKSCGKSWSEDAEQAPSDYGSFSGLI